MMLGNTDTRWGLLAQLFHWGMFLLMVGAWFAVEAREDYPKGSDERLQWMLLHKSLGVSVFFLVWLRIGARLSMVTPKALGEGALLKVSALVALGLYAVMVIMPVTGMLASWYENRPVVWFGLVELPALVAPDESMVDVFEEIHEAGFAVLMGLLALHVAGALKHHLVDKDSTLRRMLPWG